MLLAILATAVAAVIAVYTFVSVFFPWVKEDITFIRIAIRILKALKNKVATKDFAVDVLERWAREKPDRPFIIFEDKVFTYREVDERANQIARVALKLGLKSGDVASLMMLNEPAFLWTFFGLQKIGVSVAMVNYHLRLEALVHCITACTPKILFVGQADELLTALDAIRADLGDIQIVINDQNTAPKVDTEADSTTIRPGAKSLSSLTKGESTEPVGTEHRANVSLFSPATFIFTSGTTGLPKPAVLSQLRTISCQVAFQPFDFNENDVLYGTLPLYHSAGLNLGVMNVLNSGAVLILRNKFSASSFWEDCRKHRVTVIHYIGEMCRYLVNRPKDPEDGNHMIRAAVGNGLRKDIWVEFQTRFKIPHIVEFYAATESTVSLFNLSDKVGSVGRASPLLNFLFPTAFVEYDYINETAKRDANGRCVRVGANTPGLLIGALKSRRSFDGYYNREDASEKKLLHDVFKPGDLYYNTGDLFYLDTQYNVYFHDRTGDTFRWKGENVSTNEVSNVLSKVDPVHDVNVYGVTVPGCEGRAGMAAIHLKEGATLSPDQLHDVEQQCTQQLPAYARPKFLRVQRQMSLTTTFKQQKVDLVKEAYDPRNVDEPLYYYNNSSKHFEPVSESVYENIVSGKITI